jgi:hypothetical protein
VVYGYFKEIVGKVFEEKRAYVLLRVGRNLEFLVVESLVGRSPEQLLLLRLLPLTLTLRFTHLLSPTKKRIRLP